MATPNDPNVICVRQSREAIEKDISERITAMIAQRLSEAHHEDYRMSLEFHIIRTRENPWGDFAKWNITERTEKKLFLEP